MDVLTPVQRNRCMSAVRSSDTLPEVMLRRLLYSCSYRYRLHDRKLPGTPDLVFPGRRKVIFVHGCYWHRHSCKLGRQVPATNRGFWKAKLSENVRRDKKTMLALAQMGWRVLVVWECEIRSRLGGSVLDRTVAFLESD
jgi:DNA mismatch endonuclease, patch repair protein